MDNEVAQTILAQLGGSHFISMTGARHFVADGDTLRFQVPSNLAEDVVNCVSITLNGNDLYDVRFGRVLGITFDLVAEHSDVYCDNLREIFTSETGLDTSL
jgi:hypothetical protein